MAVQVTGEIRIKRRAAGGAPGAPSSLLSGTPAYNEADDTLYIGYGDDGDGNATSAIPIGGSGTFATKAYVDSAVGSAGGGDMMKSVYDTNNDGKVDAANAADAVPWSGVQSKPTTFPPATHEHDNATTEAAGFMSAADKQKLNGVAAGANNYVHPTTDGNRHVPATTSSDVNRFLKSGATAGSSPGWGAVTKSDVGLGNVDNTSDADKPISSLTQAALNAKAPLASPAFTGTPTAPTAATATNNTQIATTAFVKAVIDGLLNGVGSSFDTLKELADALGNDPNFAATVTASIAGKLAKASNLSDLTNAATARTNLGLGSMATQPANNVAITGGSIDGVVLDGGTF